MCWRGQISTGGWLRINGAALRKAERMGNMFGSQVAESTARTLKALPRRVASGVRRYFSRSRADQVVASYLPGER
jgi:hypothetical protein